MKFGRTKCPECGRPAGIAHKCSPTAAPGETQPSPLSDDAPQAPTSNPADNSGSTPVRDSTRNGRVGGERGAGDIVIVGGYREILGSITADMPAVARSALLVEAQKIAARQAGASRLGYQRVLTDAAALLHNGHTEWAAMLTAAAEFGRSNPPTSRINEHPPKRDRPPTDTSPARTAKAGEHERDRPPTDTFPARMAKVREAAAMVNQWEAHYQEVSLHSGGVYRTGTCNPCRHDPHPDGPCPCGCPTYREPTEAQTVAWDAWTGLHNAKREWERLMAEARQATPGDLFKVVRGNAVPHGTRGRIVRTHPGNYGDERALLKLDNGDRVWVTVKHLTRDSPGFAPGVADPLPPDEQKPRQPFRR